MVLVLALMVRVAMPPALPALLMLPALPALPAATPSTRLWHAS